jgi:hypothetical protein
MEASRNPPVKPDDDSSGLGFGEPDFAWYGG